MLFLFYIVIVIFDWTTCFPIKKEEIFSQYIVYYYDNKIRIGNGFYNTNKEQNSSICRDLFEKNKNDHYEYSILYEYTSLKACSIRITKKNQTLSLLSHWNQNKRIRGIYKDRSLSIPKYEIIKTSNLSISKNEQKIPWGVSYVMGDHKKTKHRTSNPRYRNNNIYIIDTGINTKNKDLNIDFQKSKCFVEGKKEDDIEDENGHGTHIAGTVGAKDNNMGVLGIVPGISIISLKVFGSNGETDLSNVLKAIDYISKEGKKGDVVNLSFGGEMDPDEKVLDKAIIHLAKRGLQVVIAAGNEHQHANNISPGRVEHSNIYTISACDKQGQLTDFSNYGTPPVDFAAPGMEILSLYKDNQMAILSGTSMAAPHVSGLLLLQQDKKMCDVMKNSNNKKIRIAHVC